MSPRRGPDGARAPTMRDVAALAGVSQSTVSFVVNERGDMRIAEETRARVLAAVEELGFRPDLTARAFRMGRTHTIGMLADQIASSPFAGRVALGAQQSAWELGSVLLMVNSGTERRFDAAAVQSLLDRKVDGLIYATVSPEQVTLPDVKTFVPVVLVNCYADPRARLSAIVPRELHGGYLAARAALDAGHRRVVFLAGDYASWATRLRARGVRAALREAGLPITAGSVVHGSYETQFGFDGLKRVMRGRSRPTAVLCANDRVALGVLFAAHELGVEIPRELSVVGYDDQEHVADSVHPALTTVRLPHLEMGIAGVQAIASLRQGLALPARQWIPPTLVVRDSVAEPRH